MKKTNIFNRISENHGDWTTRNLETWKSQISALKAEHKDAIESVVLPDKAPTDVPIIYVKKSKIVEVLKFLKLNKECSYRFLSDLTATDEHPNKLRFEVVYNLLSHSNGFSRLRVKTKVAEGDTVPTAIPVWPGANWPEREVWDMFGIQFEGHPNMKRILMDNRWEGHPLRKDYPLKKYQIFPMPQEVDMEELDRS